MPERVICKPSGKPSTWFPLERPVQKGLLACWIAGFLPCWLAGLLACWLSDFLTLLCWLAGFIFLFHFSFFSEFKNLYFIESEKWRFLKYQTEALLCGSLERKPGWRFTARLTSPGRAPNHTISQKNDAVEIFYFKSRLWIIILQKHCIVKPWLEIPNDLTELTNEKIYLV